MTVVNDVVSGEREALEQILGLSPEQLRRADRIRARLQQDRPLGEILVELGDITQSELDCVIRARRSEMTVVQLLVEDGHISEDDRVELQARRRESPKLSDRELLVGTFVTEAQYLSAYCSKHEIPLVEPETGLVDQALLDKTSFPYLQRIVALPMHVLEGKLRMILSTPEDSQLLSELARVFSVSIEACCAPSERIIEALHTLERLRGAKDSGGGLDLQYHELEELDDRVETGEEAVQIVDYLLARAIQLGASDLHVEPMQSKIRVRIRVDGVLRQLTDLPIDFAPRVVSRIKILASADIAERRLHQDGKIFVKIDGREIDIRMSSYATVHGETIVMRLLDREQGIVPLNEIGFTPRARGSLTEVVLESASGLVLLVGPTGSGKTTTLYSFVDYANTPEKKVITAEDPVEYVIDGLIQCSVNEKTGPTFADSLRAIVRQDPDTIVVGEIRDGITAALALEAALTGHKVFSTFHTEDAVGAFARLLEMGAEPFLVASTVSGIVAQRLVRRLCVACRRKGDVSAAEARFLGLDRAALRSKFHRSIGCDECKQTGYKGRVAVHEVLLPGDELRDAVMHREPVKALREHARLLPEFLTLQEDGLLKALEGLTTLEEIIGNVPRDTRGRPLATLLQVGGIGSDE